MRTRNTEHRIIYGLAATITIMIHELFLNYRSDNAGKLKLLYCWKTIFLIDFSIYARSKLLPRDHCLSSFLFFSSLRAKLSKRYLEGAYKWRFTEDCEFFISWHIFVVIQGMHGIPSVINFHFYDKNFIILFIFHLRVAFLWRDKLELNYFHLFKGDVVSWRCKKDSVTW